MLDHGSSIMEATGEDQVLVILYSTEAQGTALLFHKIHSQLLVKYINSILLLLRVSKFDVP